jgi:hypothetical protein
MSITFTEHDLSFITFLEKNLHQNLFYASLSEDKKTFNWLDSKPDGEDCKEQMIYFLIKDLKNGTKSYNYNVFNVTNSYPSYLVEAFLASRKRSSAFTLRMFDLFGQQEAHFFDKILSVANEYSNSELMLGILKKGYNYSELNHDMPLELMRRAYDKLIMLKQVPMEEIQDNFFEHIKNSHIKISEADLINLYLKIFSEENLDLLYQAFNIQKESDIVNISENTFSIISLSLKNLMVNRMYQHEIERIIILLPKLNSEFPKFSILEKNEYTLDLITLKNEINEKKIIMLFEQLMNSKYQFNEDEQNDKMILAITQQINEKVYLDSIVDGKENVKKNKMKV